MKRWLVGMIVALLLGWGFWRIGTIEPLPQELQSYTEIDHGDALTAWIDPTNQTQQSNEVRAVLSTWTKGEASFIAWLRAPSRWLHQRLNKNNETVELQRIVTRLLEMRQLADDNKSGTASKTFLDEEYRWKERIEKDARYKDTLRKGLYLGYWIFADIDDRHGSYRIKQQLEDWRLTLSRNETESLALRLSSLHSRMNESQQALEQKRYEEAALAASVSLQGLNNVANDMDQLRPRWTESQASIFGEVWSKLQSQTLALQEVIALASRNVEDDSMIGVSMATSTVDGALVASSTTTSLPIVATSTTPTAPTSTSPTITRISVIPSSTGLSFGQTISLRAYAIRDDGERSDVTSQCRFSSAPEGFGQIDKQFFSALANAGSAVITARCQLENQTYTGSVTLEVRF